VGSAVAAVVVIYLATTCSSVDRSQACATPLAGTQAAGLLEDARSQAAFELVYPCYLPNAQELESTAVTGEPGRQAASFVWTGPFEFTIRQSQYPPAVSADPSGASRITIDLFPATRATLIEQNDASGDAFYHLLWQDDDVYYELLGYGPPQQRRIILDIARSLE
jgi:hypothetical protein